MPTISPEPLPATAREVHKQRQVAESFGANVERYDRTRPRYPDAMVERIVASSPGPEVLDVGIGTGIAARQFRAAGCRVRGVEPDSRMAEFARRSGFEVEESKFETWEPAGRTFDAVIAGQTWHWVDPVAGAAKARQVLRPNGVLAVFWNGAQPPMELAERFAEVYTRLVPDSPFGRTWLRPVADAYKAMSAAAEEGIREAGGFAEPQKWRVDWVQTYTREEWLDQVPTMGGHNLLDAALLAELLTGLGAAVDAVGGAFPMGYSTEVLVASSA
ncbi:class I SAM-dependent methyltransferase [Nocardia arthritidis]|uniref:Methyltransferase domain-containing protein n=1 Tax=Nocardia arthritidis TaxID=228602 RepID=A0A6G9YGN1_9NOCA|nr:class I SAM-dependent methyltransferase [Nocardia arthritidis]QIS12300.1 methyltransferase domain-containing protein [Nocardia arthritidis]